MRKNKRLTNKTINKGLKLMVVIIVVIFTGTTVYGADDPLSVINNLSTFMFSVIRAIGMILLGWGIVQIRTSFKKS